MWGATPFYAKDVAPPALINCPPMSFSKKRCRRHMKKDLVGTLPFDFNHNGEDQGNWRSRDCKYVVKSDIGLHGKGFDRSMMRFPSKNLSALWPGKKN